MRNCTIFILFLLSWPGLLSAQDIVTPIASGTSFSCITIDQEGSIWAGTNKDGLWKGPVDSAGGLPVMSRVSSEASFNGYSLQTVKTSLENGRLNVWVGTNGNGGGTASGGGVYQFSASGAQIKKYGAERNKVVAKGMKLPSMKSDGLPTRNSRVLDVDKYGTVWSAHYYHDLTVTGQYHTVYDPYTGLPSFYFTPAGYFLTPGGLGMKRNAEGIFNNVTMDAMPYPAYTINPPFDKSPQSRTCFSLACGQDQVWMGYGGFEIDGGGYLYSGIAKFDLNGSLIGYINADNTPELPFSNTFASPRAYAIHFQKNGDPWVAFNRNLGFAVKKNFIYTNAEWVYVEKLQHYNPETGEQEESQLLPAGINFNFNAPQTITSLGKRVVLGTTAGLLVYKGEGDLKQDSSYVLITTADGLSSNNIKSVAAGRGHVYVATDAGIDRVFLPGDLEVYHIADKDRPNDESGNNYEFMSALISENLFENISLTDSDLPMFSADGTTSSIFRLYTEDFDGFYNSDKYNYGIGLDYDGEDTVRYGKLTLKPVDQYSDNSKSYVDFIYRHPLRLDDEFTEANQDAEYYLTVVNSHTFDIVFKHKIKITLPPVLLVHGVWSSISSLEYLEEGLRSQANYKAFKTLKIYKPEGGAAEYPYAHDVPYIPKGIKQLISNCRLNNMSAGKASLIVHSRGGLYSRAYIENLVPEVQYNFDIHCLITMNTPHAGSQLANVVLDERVLTFVKPVPVSMNPAAPIIKYEKVEKKLGSFFLFPVPEPDKGPRNGARVLRVDEGFIIELNEEENIKKIKEHKVPVHAIAGRTSFCRLQFTNCNLPDLDMIDIPGLRKPRAVKRLELAYDVLKFFLGDLPNTGDAFLKLIFDGEESDVIVPQSSMEAGLTGNYVSTFEGTNISHTPDLELLGVQGVTQSPIVLNRVVELLGQNMFDGSSDFSMEGYDPPRGDNKLKYNFLPQLGPVVYAPSSRMAQEEITFYLDRQITGNSYQVGDTLVTKLFTAGIDDVILVYDRPSNQEDLIYKENREVEGDSSLFYFIIPPRFNGNFTITAYGLNENGPVAMDQLELYAGIPDSISVKSIEFDSYKETIELSGSSVYYYTLKGIFKDSTEKVISDMDGVLYYLTDSSVVSSVGKAGFRAKSVGETYLIGVYQNMIDSLRFVVLDEPDFTITELGDFFVTVNEDKELIFDWSTIQEYAVEKFVIEKSEDGVSFEEFSVKAGNGSTLELHNYSFTSEPISMEDPIFFRIRVVDTAGGEDKYYRTIEVLPADVVTAVFDFENDESGTQFYMYPNPSRGEDLSVIFESDIRDQNARLEMLNLNGRVVSSHVLPISTGDNVLPLSMPPNIASGLYIVRLSTSVGQFSAKVSILK